MNIYIHIFYYDYRLPWSRKPSTQLSRKKTHQRLFFFGGGKTTTNNSGGRVFFLKFSGQQTFAFKNDFVAKLRFSILYFLADNVWKSGCLL